jgi:hypothetical protein
MKFLKKYLLLFTLLLLVSSCFKSDNSANNKLPFVVVNFNVSLTAYQGELGFPTGFKVFPGGHRGILVVNIDGENFRAFDLATPHMYLSECANPMDISQLPFVISTCGGREVKYNVYNPNAFVDGENFSLKEYFVFSDGANLRITN